MKTAREFACRYVDACDTVGGVAKHCSRCDELAAETESRDRAHAERLREAEALLRDARDLFDAIANPDHPKPTDQRDWQGWVTVFDFVQRVASNGRHRLRVFLAASQQSQAANTACIDCKGDACECACHDPEGPRSRQSQGSAR